MSVSRKRQSPDDDFLPISGHIFEYCRHDWNRERSDAAAFALTTPNKVTVTVWALETLAKLTVTLFVPLPFVLGTWACK
jgi:hypothetical protein